MLTRKENFKSFLVKNGDVVCACTRQTFEVTDSMVPSLTLKEKVSRGCD